MSDEVERQLDEFYRSLDGPARRVEARWGSRLALRRGRSPGGSPLASWGGASAAAAAVLLLIVLAQRSGPAVPATARLAVPQAEPVVPGTQEPRPGAPPSPPSGPPPGPRTPSGEPERPAPPAPARRPGGDEPRSSPAPAPPAPADPGLLPREAPASTRAAKAVAVLRETDGVFELGDRGLRGRQKEVPVSGGDRLRALTLVRLTLADERILLLAPRTVLEFRPEEGRLAVSLEQGELLADLIGPGPELHVVTKACEVTPLGTVFGVRVEAGRVQVLVEKGRVEVQTPKARATLRAAEGLVASEEGTLGPAGPADLRSLAWARGHRPAELVLFAEDFSRPGSWVGEIEKGVARAVAAPGSGALLHLATQKPAFEVPVRGQLAIVCRTDRASKLKVQLFAADLRMTYKVEVPLLRGTAWRTLTLGFEEFQPTDRSRAPLRLPPGSPVTDLVLMYGEEEERGSLWVSSIKVTEQRP